MRTHGLPRRALAPGAALVAAKGVAATAVLALIALPAPALAAPTGVLGLPAGPVGATAAPDTAWLAAVRPCTHYVDTAATNASDANPGTSAQPWKTIRRAVDLLAPGQTGCVRAGTYPEGELRAVNSGTAANPIALRADGPVTIQPTAPVTAASAQTFVFESGSTPMGYWLLDGFAIDKAQRNGTGVWLLGGGSGLVQRVAVRNTVIRNGKAGSGVLVRGRVTDVLLENNEVTGYARWVSGSSVSYTEQTGYGRADAHGLSIEGTGGSTASVERVRAVRNSFHDNGGDGVQCLTDTDGASSTPAPGDPADIDLVDNRIVNTPGSAPIEENAVDIKSCQRVSVRGTNTSYNKFAEFLPTRKAVDANSGGNSANGEAVVLHYRARGVLIENLRIWNACGGVTIGTSGAQVRDVVLKRVLLFGLRAAQALDPADAGRCKGNGVAATNATRLDLTHLTLDGVPGTGVELNSWAGDVTDVDLWNTIVVLKGTASRWVALSAGLSFDTIDSDYNLFWHPDNSSSHFVLNNNAVDLAAWRNENRDLDRPDPLGSHRADPLFVADTAANDYYTQAGSPARDGALANTGATYCGARPDIGFLESC